MPGVVLGFGLLIGFGEAERAELGGVAGPGPRRPAWTRSTICRTRRRRDPSASTEAPRCGVFVVLDKQPRHDLRRIVGGVRNHRLRRAVLPWPRWPVRVACGGSVPGEVAFRVRSPYPERRFIKGRVARWHLPKRQSFSGSEPGWPRVRSLPCRIPPVSSPLDPPRGMTRKSRSRI